jgi:hypothetical protein
VITSTEAAWDGRLEAVIEARVIAEAIRILFTGFLRFTCWLSTTSKFDVGSMLIVRE